MVGDSDITFGDLPEARICGYIPGQILVAAVLTTCHPRMYGRYVRVTAADVNNRLSIYELEVHGLDL